MKVFSAAFLALVVVFSGGTVHGLKCRSGFNTTVYGIPLHFWDDQYQCSATSQQSCFLGEISYETSFLEGQLPLTYGSCVSTAYEHALECESLFYGPDGLDIDSLVAMLPNFEGQFTKAIQDFSKDAAKGVVEYIKNENGQLDNVKVVESILNPILESVNLTVPQNVKPVLTKLDTLILTAVLNASQIPKALDEFLSSFGQLNTPDVAASTLLYDIFDRNNVTVPVEFHPMINNVPGFVEQYISNEQLYAVVNTTLYNFLAGLDINDPKATAMAMVSVLKEWIPEEYNLHKLLDSFPELIEQLMLPSSNDDYFNKWGMDMLKSYSNVTAATEAVSNSIFRLLERIGYLSMVESEEELKNLIVYYPGYFYTVLPPELHGDLETALLSISQILDSFDPARKTDLGDLFGEFSVNISDPGVASAVEMLDDMLNAVVSGDWSNPDAVLMEVLRVLNDSATRTEESVALSNAILNFLEIYKVNRTSDDIIYSIPGLFITAFPQHRDLINMIYSNISQNLVAYDFTNPDYGAIMKGSISPLLMVNEIPANVKAFLEELGPTIDVSDPVGSMQKSVVLLEKVALPEMNETMMVMNTLPELLSQLLSNNMDYLNTWTTQVLKAFSKETPATMRFSDSVSEMTQRFNLTDNITSEIQAIIAYQPGIIYQFYAYVVQGSTELEELDYAYDNMSLIVDSIDRSKTIDLAGLLSLIPNFQSFPGLDRIIEVLEGFIGVAVSGDVNEMGMYALEALKNSSTLTEKSSELSDSIISLMDRMNVSLPDEWQEVIKYYPGLFIAAYPEQITFIDTIYANISQGLDSIGMTEESLSNGVESLLSQLSTLGISLTAEAQTLIREFPTKFNISDPVGTLEAVLEILRAAIPAEYSGVIMPLLDTLPELLSQLFTENFLYVRSWTIELLRLSSTTTIATEALKDSVLGLIERIGLGSYLDDDIMKWIQYQPGFFYQYFPGKTEDINYVFLNVSQIMDKVDPTNPDFQSLLELMGVTVPPELSPMIEAAESFVGVASTGNVTLILDAAIEMVMNLSTTTIEGTRLGTAIILMLDTTGIRLPIEFENIIKNLPDVFVTFFPAASEMVKMIYDKTAEGIENSMNPTYGIPESVNELMVQLQLANVTIPPEILTLADSIQQLMEDVFSNSTTAVEDWIVRVLPLVTPAKTSSSVALSNAIRHFLSQMPLPPVQAIETAIEHVPRIPYAAFPDSKDAIDSAYNGIANGLLSINLTYFDPATVESALADLMPLVPAQLHPLLSGVGSLIDAVINNKTVAQWGLEMQSAYCTSNSVTTKFADSMMAYLKQFPIDISEDIKPAFECVPGILYTFLPNQTDILDNAFGQVILLSTNYTAYVEQQFKQININLTRDLVAFLERWPDIQLALINGNTEDLISLLGEVQQEMAIETELSKLVETILTKAGVNMTEEILMSIRQSTSGVYNPQLAAYFPTFDTIFSSLNVDIQADKDIGVAIIDAFTEAKIAIPDRYLPVLNNLQSLMNAAIAQNGNAINKVVLDIMIAYNASFPSDQVQYQIYQMKLQISLQSLTSFTDIPSEVFENVGEMYRLLLKMAKVTEDELKQILLKTFPDGTFFIEIFFQIDPKDAFAAIANFTSWILDNNRNVETLASYIQETINILLTRHNIDLASILKTLIAPQSCKYKSCRTDSCNTGDLLEDILPVTQAKTTRATPTTTSRAESEDTTTTKPPTTTVAVTTTSGHVINSNAVNVSFLTLSILLSTWFL